MLKSKDQVHWGWCRNKKLTPKLNLHLSVKGTGDQRKRRRKPKRNLFRRRCRREKHVPPTKAESPAKCSPAARGSTPKRIKISRNSKSQSQRLKPFLSLQTLNRLARLDRQRLRRPSSPKMSAQGRSQCLGVEAEVKVVRKVATDYLRG